MEVNKSVTTLTENNNRIVEWESGLPSPSELPSIRQSLMSPELSLLFGITPKPLHVLLGINQLSSTSVCCRPKEKNSEPDPLKPIPDKTETSDNFKRRIDAISGGEQASNPGTNDPIIISNNDNNNADHDEHNGGDVGNRAVKRPRLVWTPQLHKRFVDVIEHLGVDKAVPKTIMEMMNVEGLTRENVASHLQKYRLYLKRVKAILGDRVSSSKPSATATVGPPDNGSNGCGAVGIFPSPTIDVDDDQCPPPNNNGFNLGGSGDGTLGGRQVAFRQQLHTAGFCNSVPPPLIMPLPRVMGTGTAGAVGSGGYTSYVHLGMPTSAAAAGGTSLWD